MSEESGSSVAEGHEAALKDLERAEAEVLGLLALAEETVNEMKRVPETDEDLLRELSQGYLESVKTVQKTLKTHAAVLDEKQEDAGAKATNEKNGGFQQQYNLQDDYSG